MGRVLDDDMVYDRLGWPGVLFALTGQVGDESPKSGLVSKKETFVYVYMNIFHL